MTGEILLRCLANAIYGSIFILLVVLIRQTAGRWVSKRYICVLWIIAALRLVIPVSFETSFGVLPQISGINQIFDRFSSENTIQHTYNPEPAVQNTSDTEEITEAYDGSAENDRTDELDSSEYITVEPVKNKAFNILSVIWLIGAGLMFGYMAAGMIQTGRKVKFAVPDTYRIRLNPAYTDETKVKVYTSEDIIVPFLYGLINPKIYLPHELTDEDRVHVIRHELAHIKRFDHIIKPLYFAVLAVCWFNPLVWVAFRMFSADMEMACDEMVIDDYDPDTRNEYILALLSAAGKNHYMRLFQLPFGKPPLKERINRVLGYKKNSRIIRFASIITIIIVSAVFSSVHVSAGQDNTVITDYDIVIPVIDDATGDRYLLIPYSKDLNAYVMQDLDDSIEADVKEKSSNYWYERPLSDYTITEDDATGLEYIVKNGDALWEGHVLLHDSRDKEKYDALAQDYCDRYMQVIPDTDVGYIYADEEVKGLAERHPDGFLFLQTGTLMYIDTKDSATFGWRLGLTTDEYMRLEKWMSQTRDESFDHTDFEAWKPVLYKLGIDYGDSIDTSSGQYKAAYEELMGDETDYPPRGMTEEQAQEQIRYYMKQFDEDGDRVPFGTVPGMLVTEENSQDRKTIIQIPDDIRQMMFDLNKEEFLKWNGMGVDTERSRVFKTYQEQADKEDRLKGTWTLGQYERIYNQFFADAVKNADPKWQPGEDFDRSIITGISRDRIEMYIYVDGSELKYDPSRFATEESCNSEQPVE